MRDDVVPHKYIKEKTPDDLKYKSQLSDSDRKRTAEALRKMQPVKIPKLLPKLDVSTEVASTSDDTGEFSGIFNLKYYL